MTAQLTLTVDPLASVVDAVAIPLGRGLFALVDPGDAATLSGDRWYAARMGKTWYAYRRRSGAQEFMHRIVLGLRRHDGRQADHVNGNGLDNRRANLRLSTKAENGRNRGPNRNNTTGYKRVCYVKRLGRWLASIQVDRLQINLGLYDDPIDAALAYDLAAIEHFGAFAWTNFLRPPDLEVPTRKADVDTWRGTA